MAAILQEGDWAAAVRTTGGWALKPVCLAQPDKPALAVRAGRAWALAPFGKQEGERYVVVRAGAGRILLPLSCPDEGGGGEEPCAGNDPLCPFCPCTAHLEPNYLISISGFPAVCGAEIFNGVWTVSQIAECVWQYQIDQWNYVRLIAQEGPFWRVAWATGGPGGLAGHFGGQGEEGCAPEKLEYFFWQVFNPYGCEGLVAGVMAASVLVSKME